MAQPMPQSKETIEYMEAMLAQLHRMASHNQHDMLAYLIEMAWVEASETLRELDKSRLEEDRD